MRRAAAVLVWLLVAGSATTLCAQEFWQKKDYPQWSKEECQKLLQDSPWVKRYVIKETLITPVGAESAVPGREENPEIAYQVQLRSALPIRQALVREQRLAPNYEKSAPEQRQAFDQQAEKFLGAQFADRVVIRVKYSSNVDSYERQLGQYWQKQTAESLHNFVFLIGPHGEKIAPLRYVHGPAGAREFELIFPRQVEGRPLVSPGDKTLQLEFPHPALGVLPEARVLVEFKVSKMLVLGQVSY